MKLELGGGLSPTPGYTNLDPVHGEGSFKRRAQDTIPLPDNAVEAARCSHLLEHIPSGADRINVFNEVWRVLAPGGAFEIIVPLVTPNAVGASWGAYADPTHVSFWVRESFEYFTRQMAAADYGIHYWQMVSWATVECDWGLEGHVLLRKP